MTPKHSGADRPLFDIPVTRAEFLKLPRGIRRRALERMARKEERLRPGREKRQMAKERREAHARFWKGTQEVLESEGVPRLEWDSEAQACYVRFRQGKVKRTITRRPYGVTLNVDLDQSKRVVGVELLLDSEL